jgi:dynamin family protein
MPGSGAGARHGFEDVRATVERLERLASLAARAQAPGLAESATQLAARVGEGRFYVVCLGQFKRGKSTLIDALVGDAVLPAAVVPVTSVPTIVRYGERRSARVRRTAGSWMEIQPERLIEYVSEEHNPENRMGILGVEVFVPSSLLASGMCLVDTPGLGSVFNRSTVATQQFVPQIDAALAVIGADPPLTGAELDLLERVARDVPDLLFVLNKADRLSAGERDEASAFARSTLEQRLSRPVGRILQVSAKEQLDRSGPTRDWEELRHALEELASRSGAILASRAAERGLRRLAERLLERLAEERRLLAQPLEDSERRVRELTATIASAERSLDDLGHLLSAEQERLARSFAVRRRAFLAQAGPLAGAELASRCERLERRSGPALRRDALGLAQEIARRHVLPWLGTEQAEAERAYRATAERFSAIAREFLDRLDQSGAPESIRPPRPPELQLDLDAPSRFYFNELIRVAQPASPFRFAMDLLLGALGLSRTILADAGRFLGWLLEMNSTRVESDLNERVLESRRRLESSLRGLLEEVRAWAEDALTRVRTTRAAGTKAVEQELSRIGDIENQLRELVSNAG